MSKDAPAIVAPIGPDDVGVVASFLHDHLNPRVGTQAWEAAMRAPWQNDPPNHGYCLRVGDRIVGAYLALYATRMVEGEPERVCNLAAWSVLQEYRFSSVRLLRALLAQDGYHFTDLSPSGSVIALNQRLGFQFLDTSTALMPNVLWPTWPGAGAITAEVSQLQATLRGADLEIYRDHALAPAAHHLLLTGSGEGYCYVIFRRDRRRNLPVFANLLYVSNGPLLVQLRRQFARYLLVHHRLLGTLAELRVVGERIGPSVMMRSPRRKMFRSDSLRPEHIDYLYSELVAIAW
ncbi:MAG: hypothetical protein ACKV2O_23760 [Acidimicrobiales bacterium]